MNIIKLNSSHADLVKSLFYKDKFMVKHLTNTHIGSPNDLVDLHYLAFQTTYLTDLVNYHAFGALSPDGEIIGLSSFYESTDEASWYGTGIRNSGNKQTAQSLLDAMIKHNEEQGRFKFYTLWSTKHARLLRRFAFSKYNNERYDYFDEFYVNERHACLFSMPWQILYNRSLSLADTTVRCTFLKQKYRTLFNAGRL